MTMLRGPRVAIEMNILQVTHTKSKQAITRTTVRRARPPLGALVKPRPGGFRCRSRHYVAVCVGSLHSTCTTNRKKTQPHQLIERK